MQNARLKCLTTPWWAYEAWTLICLRMIVRSVQLNRKHIFSIVLSFFVYVYFRHRSFFQCTTFKMITANDASHLFNNIATTSICMWCIRSNSSKSNLYVFLSRLLSFIENCKWPVIHIPFWCAWSQMNLLLYRCRHLILF